MKNKLNFTFASEMHKIGRFLFWVPAVFVHPSGKMSTSTTTPGPPNCHSDKCDLMYFSAAADDVLYRFPTTARFTPKFNILINL